MNTTTRAVGYGQRVKIARDRWIDDTRTDRLALALEVHTSSRWGAALAHSERSILR